MSLPHATRPKEGASPRSTRQLLDELDSLMNQMLALPVEDEPDYAPPLTKPAIAATLTLIEPDAEAPLLSLAKPETHRELGTDATKHQEATANVDDEILSIRDEETFIPSSITPESGSESDAPSWTAEIFDSAPPTEEQRNRPAESFALVDLDDEAATNALLAVEPAKPQAATTTLGSEIVRRPLPPSSASWTTGALVVWDRAFRRMTRRFGLFGWLLRTALGRVILGMAGLSFWIISLAWLVRDWLRWTR